MDLRATTTIITDPAAEPVTLAELKDHLRIEVADEDDFLDALITAAREWVEGWTGRAFVTRTLETRLDRFPVAFDPVSLDYIAPGQAAPKTIDLPVGPVRSVTSITYIAGDGTLTTWASSGYQVDTVSPIARIAPAFGSYYPATRHGDFGAVRILYEAGYAPGDGSPADYAENVPKRVKQAIKLLAGHWEANRTAVLTGTISKEVEFSLASILWSLRTRAN